MNPNETILIDIPLTTTIRELLNNQTAIQAEMLLNVTELPYTEYIKFLKEKKENGEDAPFITEKILKQLFDNFPNLGRIRNELIISTFRTSLLTPSGLNGETNMHKDNILFPNSTNRNLLITWGLGTEGATLLATDFLDFIWSKLYPIVESTENYSLNDDDYVPFKDDFFEHPDETLSTIHEKYSPVFCDIVKEAIRKFPDIANPSVVKVVRSSGPNKDNNISAICLSGKNVYHKRMTSSGAPYYRYALNIYFNSASLPIIGGKKKIRKTKKRTHKKSYKKSHRK
jgi:hypothetical protein